MWLAVKREGNALFSPEAGGSYKVFEQHSMQPMRQNYCTQDVQYSPLLAKIYEMRSTTKWSQEVCLETEKRLQEPQDPSFEPHGKHKGLGPRYWATLSKTSRKGRTKPQSMERGNLPQASIEQSSILHQHQPDPAMSDKRDPHGKSINETKLEKQKETRQGRPEYTPSKNEHFVQWRWNIPKDAQHRRRAQDLHPAQMSAFIQETLRPATWYENFMQEVLTLLGGKGGRLRLAQIRDQDADTMYQRCTEQPIRYFELFAHCYAGASPFVKHQRADLLKDLRGIGGERILRALVALARHLQHRSQNRSHHLQVGLLVLVDALEVGHAFIRSEFLNKNSRRVLELSKDCPVCDLMSLRIIRLLDFDILRTDVSTTALDRVPEHNQTAPCGQSSSTPDLSTENEHQTFNTIVTMVLDMLGNARSSENVRLSLQLRFASKMRIVLADFFLQVVVVSAMLQ